MQLELLKKGLNRVLITVTSYIGSSKPNFKNSFLHSEQWLHQTVVAAKDKFASEPN
jgi:hypothetical protein